MPISPTLIEHIDFMREVVIRTVQCMPEDKLTYTPVETCRSFLEIVLHIGRISWRNGNLLTGRTDLPEHNFSADALGTQPALIAMLREEQERTRAVLSSVREAALQATYAVLSGDRTGLELVHMTLMHEADHHGNLVVLAKLCGVNPPDLVAVRKQLRGV